MAESWIADEVNLIPRLRGWIDQYCPGTKLAVTEYSWGADDGPSGALAQAEVMAIFGREGVDLARRWVAPEPGTRTVGAFRLFVDYDGAGGVVGGTGVEATSNNLDGVTAYAAEDGALPRVLLVAATTWSPAKPTWRSLASAVPASSTASPAEPFGDDRRGRHQRGGLQRGPSGPLRRPGGGARWPLRRQHGNRQHLALVVAPP